METNNKLREVLKMCVDELCARCRDLAKAQGDPMPCLNGCEPVRKAKSALAAPPRNCDVGTVEEQLERFDKFCHANINTERCCGNCPAFRTTRYDCELIWAQMPYEKEGGAK